MDFCLPFSEFISLTQYKTNSRLAPVPANTTVKTRSAARRPHVREACPALVIGEGQVSTEEEKVSARRGLRMMEERDSWGESRVPPEGVNFFQRRIFVNFCLRQILLSLS